MAAAAAFTPLAQILLSFATGVLLSPLSYGLLFFLAFLVIYELLYLGLCRGDWGGAVRAGVLMAAVLGWIAGRTATGVPVP